MQGLESAIVSADETHINSIFSNLVLNVKDALEEVDSARPKEIKVAVDKQKDQTHDRDGAGLGYCEALGAVVWWHH